MIDDVADGVGSAGARVSADRVHAGAFWGAVVILGTLDLEDRLGGAAGTAAAADVAARAHAHHGANRARRQYPTFGRIRARLYNRARVLALVVQAGERVRAVAVLPALGSLLRPTIDVGVAGEVERAATYRQVIQHSALGACRARIVVHAGVDALRVDARVITRAVAVTVATDHAAAVQRIAVVTLAAAAVGQVIIRIALGVGAARLVRNQTRVHAVVVRAGLVEGALAIVPALDGVTRDLRITLVVLFARADRLVIPHVAYGVVAAVTGIAALSVDAGLTIAAVVVRGTCPDHRQLYYGIRMRFVNYTRIVI